MTSTTPRKTAAVKPSEPPAAAVAADAHWSAKMQRLRDRQLAETVFVVCDDIDVKIRYDRAVRNQQTAAELLKANPRDPEAKKEATAAERELDEAKAAHDQVAIPIRLRALPRPALEALYKAHPPSEEERDDGAEWGKTFPAAVIAASSVEGMTEEEAIELLDVWSLSEANALFNAAMSVQNTTRSDLGKG